MRAFGKNGKIIIVEPVRHGEFAGASRDELWEFWLREIKEALRQLGKTIAEKYSGGK